MSASCYSHIKALVLNAIFILPCIPTNAQTQRYTMSEDFTKQIETFEGLTGTRFSHGIPGTLKYCYKLNGDSDKKIKDGSLTINCHVSSCKDSGWSWVYTLKNGRYSVHANFKEDQLNGPYSAQLSYTMVQDTYDNWGDRTSRSTDIVSQSVTCSFKDAKPHGRFLMKGTGRGTISATFNNGKITGLFSIFGYKGNISPSGKPIGLWKMGETYNFQNGVLISKSDHIDSYEPSLARKYATKQISKEGLSEYGYCVRIDSIDLGERLRDVICDFDLFDFNKLKNNTNKTKGYDFSTPNIVKYEYLKKRCTFTDKGFERFCQIIQDAELNYPDLNCYNYEGYRLYLECDDRDTRTISDLVLTDSTSTYENIYVYYSQGEYDDELWTTDDLMGNFAPTYYGGPTKSRDIYLKHSQFQKLKKMTEYAQEEKEYKDEQESIYNHVFEYSEVPTKPKFSQGDIFHWLLNNININCTSLSDSDCEKLEKKYIVIRFIVEKDGSIENAQITLGQNEALDVEALRIVSEMPKWSPGYDDNYNKIRVGCNIYIPCFMFIPRYNRIIKSNYSYFVSSSMNHIPID